MKKTATPKQSILVIDDCPEILILLEMQMQILSGAEFLTWLEIKKPEIKAAVPIVGLSTSTISFLTYAALSKGAPVPLLSIKEIH